MQNNLIETIVGVAVIIVAAVFLIFGRISTSKQPSQGSIAYKASFDSVEGIAVNSEVKIGGVRVGFVSNIELDPSFQVVLTLKVDKTLNIPADSSAEIATAGLMGDKFISIIPGGEEESLKEGDSFSYTRSGFSIEKLVGMVVSSFLDKPKTTPAS